MANVTGTVYNVVCSHDGIKCIDIVNITHMKINHVSGILTSLKHRGKVFNEDSLWYKVNSIPEIKRILDDIHESLSMPLGEWAEGYVSALVGFDIIDENGFDELIRYIKE